jgi:hypothetical protein
VSPKEPNRARRDGVSLHRFSLRRARGARLRPSASGLHERSAGDDADAAETEPYPPRVAVGEGGVPARPRGGTGKANRKRNRFSVPLSLLIFG